MGIAPRFHSVRCCFSLSAMTVLLCLTAFLASLLTLFSGFGLGTLLMPVAAIFFPVAVAVALTALVHLLNSLFKLAVLGRHVAWGVAVRFGLPALVAAIPGAWLLSAMAGLPPLARYSLAGLEAQISPVKLAVGALLVLFAAAEAGGWAKRVQVGAGLLPLGGLLSGFFGGLSGHQGAFRSAFLVHAGLSPQAFVATNAAIASLIDLTRLAVYGLNLERLLDQAGAGLVVMAALSAFAGVLVGRLGVRKVTIGAIQRLVAGLLFTLGVLLIAGIL